MKYVNLTPRWTEILPTWQRIAINNVNDTNFWEEMNRIAQGADNFNDLVAYLRAEKWTDIDLEEAIGEGRSILEARRNTIKESVDDLP